MNAFIVAAEGQPLKNSLQTRKCADNKVIQHMVMQKDNGRSYAAIAEKDKIPIFVGDLLSCSTVLQKIGG